MKAVAINGSPRKGWNTETLLKEALRGAESVGAETKLFQLYDVAYTGCKSCFGCKRKGAESWRCALKDGLTPVLDEIFTADALFLGSPIYFGNITGQMASFMERLVFPLLSYDDYSKHLFSGKIHAACIYTMNAPEEYYNGAMGKQLREHAGILSYLGGEVATYASCDTYQFTDYAKYHSGSFDEPHKRRVREEKFPQDMAAVYAIGRKLMDA